MSEPARQLSSEPAEATRRLPERCPSCGGDLEPTGSIAGRRGVLYLIARCLRCQTAFWRAPGSGRPWE
ncbi:MAG: hypothetical protein ACRDJO_06630 [Actinomycetota bacterium]